MKPGTKRQNPARRYHDHVRQVLGRIIDSQMCALERAAGMVADTVRHDGLVYTLGSGHSLLVAAELYFRAGGLANFDVLHDKTFGRAERLPGYAKVLLDSYPVGGCDLLIIVSNSGRNCLPVELALEARKRSVPTIAITSLDHSRTVSSRAGSGARLFEVCDVVIDNCGVRGDAGVDIGDGAPLQVGPTSTLAGIFIAHCIVGLAARMLLEQGVRPPVLVSSNLDGGDDTNRSLIDFIRERIRGL
jgi:uncharacterized phosphosugar-binding protein